MKSQRLSFAEINLLKDNLAEVIVDEGVEMTSAMVDEYHKYLLDNLTAPFLLLVNKLHSYSYDAEAQYKLGNLKEIDRMAVVSYRLSSTTATEQLTELPWNCDWNLQIFTDRETALSWLLGD
ncbi:MAG: hypothetical protein P8Y20_00315 [Gammaproteobacteria bacterium]|jgi:DNA polymerase III alpha subunit (gram-positive type)